MKLIRKKSLLPYLGYYLHKEGGKGGKKGRKKGGRYIHSAEVVASRPIIYAINSDFQHRFQVCKHCTFNRLDRARLKHLISQRGQIRQRPREKNGTGLNGTTENIMMRSHMLKLLHFGNKRENITTSAVNSHLEPDGARSRRARLGFVAV